jgi:threonine/homoserine/homoserine lactone efflux protein
MEGQRREIMNRAQKGAWFTLGISVLLLAFIASVFTQMFSAGATSTKLIKLVRIWSLAILLFMVVSLVLLRIKQSRAEVDIDERDNSIRKTAVLVSFVSLWVLLIAASVIPSFILGDAGSIPVCFLPIINLGVFLMTMLVYSVAVLFQYGGRDKDGEK